MAKNQKNAKTGRSETEEKEYYRGLIREKNKRIKFLERENSRLTKYLSRMNYDTSVNDEEELHIVSPRKKDKWRCKECGSFKCDKLILGIKQYITCNGCGDRSRVNIDE